MTKNELVKEMAEKSGVSVADAQKCLDGFTSSVTDALKRKDKLTLVGFGTFETKDRAAREGRNPSNGETIQIKAAKVPSFKAGKSLKDAVNS
jgi:DNA-binding protein HU-beta